MIRDLSKAQKLDSRDKRLLRTYLRLLYGSKPQSSYTKHELEAQDRVIYFVEHGILEVTNKKEIRE